MPAFDGILSAEQIALLVGDVKGFAPKAFLRSAKSISILEVQSRDAARGARLFSESCAACHGAEGRGDGAAAKELRPPPFDLTSQPLRRGQSADDIYLTLATGLDGTAMPAFALSGEDLWSLVAFVDSIRSRAPSQRPRLDATGIGERGLSIAPQGQPPPSLSPAAQSLSALQCGRCHAKQVREWTGSVHGRAVSPGLLAQLIFADAKMVSGCQSCHAPLVEQNREPLRSEGVSCAGCHLRNFVRHGPPRRADSALLPLPAYPLVVDSTYERADFCLPCHQLPPEDAVNGKPLLDTYREWLSGPYMPRGVQCQHCHMPDREHSFRGVHDPETVRQGVKLDVSVTRNAGGVDASIALTNVGAAHYLPTTTTPAMWVIAEADGVRKEKRIGRKLVYRGEWIEEEDTRIPPGESVTFAPHFSSSAKEVHVTVTMVPDDYYEGFYRSLLATEQRKEARTLLEAALKQASASKYVVWEKTVDVK